jgi:N-acetylmuramoyl-L-alanine amidase
MQDKYIDKSIEFSSIIQKQFVDYCRRYDRGVRQAGFWVLHRSACPSVLIELGFISNPAEERYLASKQGQNELAIAIYNAFVDFKRKHDKKSGRQASTVMPIEKTTVVEEPIITDENPKVITTEEQIVESAFAKPETPVTQPIQSKPETNAGVTNLPVKSNQVPVFKVQLFATTKILKAGAAEFHGVKNVEYFTEGGLNKYTVGAETDYNKIEKIRAEVLSKFPQAFIIAFVDNKKMTAKDALKLVSK